jgi:hypothetical protein
MELSLLWLADSSISSSNPSRQMSVRPQPFKDRYSIQKNGGEKYLMGFFMIIVLDSSRVRRSNGYYSVTFGCYFLAGCRLDDSEVAYENLLLLDGRLRYRLDGVVAAGVNILVFSLLLLILIIGLPFVATSFFNNVLLLTTVANFDATVD